MGNKHLKSELRRAAYDLFLQGVDPTPIAKALLKRFGSPVPRPVTISGWGGAWRRNEVAVIGDNFPPNGKTPRKVIAIREAAAAARNDPEPSRRAAPASPAKSIAPDIEEAISQWTTIIELANQSNSLMAENHRLHNSNAALKNENRTLKDAVSAPEEAARRYRLAIQQGVIPPPASKSDKPGG